MLRIDDQRARGAILDHESELGTGEAKIERHEDRAEPRRGEHGEEEHRLVEAEKGDPVAFRHSERDEPRCAILDRLLHLGVGPVAALEAQRFPLGAPQGALEEPVGKADVRGHSFLPFLSASFEREPRLQAALPVSSGGISGPRPFALAAAFCAAFARMNAVRSLRRS